MIRRYRLRKSALGLERYVVQPGLVYRSTADFRSLRDGLFVYCDRVSNTHPP